MKTITMVKNSTEITFNVMTDCSFTIAGSSEVISDFADYYIKLRDAGFVEKDVEKVKPEVIRCSPMTVIIPECMDMTWNSCHIN